MAVWTQAQAGRQEVGDHLAVLREFGLGAGGGVGLVERGPAGGEESRAASVGEEAVVADADEAFREDVEQEATRELRKRKREGSSSVAAVVLEAEGDAVVVDVKKPVVRDRDAVRVAGEIGQDMLGPLEGSLRVDDPLGATGLVKEALERIRSAAGCEAAVELELALS